MKTITKFTYAAFAALALAGFLAYPAGATIESDGTLDPSFNAGQFTNGTVNAAIVQPDGKLLIAGYFSKVNGVGRHSIARLNSDGTLDLSFDAGTGPDNGVGLSPLSSNSGMILQPDGKIIIWGGFPFDTVNGVPRNGLARLNSNGSLDTAFDPARLLSQDGVDDGNGGALHPGIVNGVVLQSDGKLVVTGQFFFVMTGGGTSVARSCVARFNSGGSFDPTYNPGNGLVNTAGPSAVQGHYAAKQSSGKVLIGGVFDQFDGNPTAGLVRLNTDGSYDGTFNPGSAASPDHVGGLFVQADDQVIVFGDFTTFNGFARSSLVRLDATTGAVDTTFNTAAINLYGDHGLVEAIAEQPDHKLLVGGFFQSVGATAAAGAVRLNTDGTQDPSFDTTIAAGKGIGANVFAMWPTNRIFIGGYFSTYNGATRNNIAVVDFSGNLDNTFPASTGVIDGYQEIMALATQSDGKVIVGGLFSSVQGEPHYNIVRLNPDGSIDHTFAITHGTTGTVRGMFIQPDGKIMIAGQFRSIDNTPWRRVARLNPDGSIDTSFNPGVGPDQIIYAIAGDSSGNYYIGGDFQNVSNTPRVRLAKLKPDGSLDTAFDPGAGFETFPKAIVASDAGVVVGGRFTTYQGSTVNHLARVDSTTAALDTGFVANNMNWQRGNVRALALTPDGSKYLVGSGGNPFGVVRLNLDGSFDESFNTNHAIYGPVFSLAQQDGKIFAGGAFTTGAGVDVTHLLADGSTDPGFNTGTGPTTTPNAFVDTSDGTGFVEALSIAPDGSLVIGGIFNQYSGTPRICLARLTVAPTVVTPAGSDVMVNIGTVGSTPIALTFPQVTVAGTTTVMQIAPSSAGTLPSAYELTGGDLAFEITTTATYTTPPPIIIAFQVSVDPAIFSQLRVLHNEGGTLVDVTASNPPPDPITQTIYASVNSLSPFVIAKLTLRAQVQQPINADGSSVFSVRRGVVPVKFTLTDDGSSTCTLPSATIAVTRTAGGTIGAIDESVYSGSADTGSNFRIASCQYAYNLSASALGVGTYRVDIKINGTVVGSGIFGLK